MKKDLHTKLPSEFVCKSKNQYVMCYSVVTLIIAYFSFKAKCFIENNIEKWLKLTVKVFDGIIIKDIL